MFGGSVSDTNFLAYLREQVGEAVRTAERHDMLRLNIRKLRSGLEVKYQLSSVQVILKLTGSLILEWDNFLRLQLCPVEPPLPSPSCSEQVGAEYAATISEQERQVESLQVLEQAMLELGDQGLNFEGTSIQLYHPKVNLSPFILYLLAVIPFVRWLIPSP